MKIEPYFSRSLSLNEGFKSETKLFVCVWLGSKINKNKKLESKYWRECFLHYGLDYRFEIFILFLKN